MSSSSSLPSRVACLWVPHLLVQAHRRADPALDGAPLLVVDVERATSPLVIDAAPEARALGVGPGQVLAQARAMAPEVVVRPRAPALERSALAALDDLAASFSPRAERASDDAMLARADRATWLALDVSDLGRLFPSEGHVATALHLGARRVGLEARVGVARDPETARVVARAAARGEDVTVVPPGREPATLAALPVHLLDPSPEVAVLLERWGVRSIGELASLPSGGVALRLGAEGARLAEVARGEARRPLVARGEALTFEEALELEWPVDDVQALGFVLRRVVDNLAGRLACRALAASGLTLALTLDPSFLDAEAAAGAALDVRTIGLQAATRDPATLHALLRAQLEGAPPRAPVVALTLAAQAGRSRPSQLGLFDPPGPSPDRLATLLARLGALVGEGRIGAPVVADSHRPDAVQLAPFRPGPVPTAPPPTPLPAPAPAARTLALHAYRPPRAVAVRFDRGRLRFVEAEALSGQVLDVAGPFRVRDAWWQAGAAMQRDYYDVALSDGAVYRLFRDLLAATDGPDDTSWYLDGVYE